jgi:hypothetical protein
LPSLLPSVRIQKGAERHTTNWPERGQPQSQWTAIYILHKVDHNGNDKY